MSVDTLTPASKQSFGEYICNFLEWCELRNLDWRLLDYKTHILSGYQKEMSAGSFSANHRGLAPSTVNSRVQEVWNFLEWAASRAFRTNFDVPTITVSVSRNNPTLSHGHKTKDVEIRVGGVRPDPKSLHMPSRDAMARWLESVRIEKGITKHLMAELVIRTGIRREEAVQWRMHTLPERKSEWNIKGGEVEVMIEYGAKGPKRYNGFGDLVGPQRMVLLPLEIAEKLHNYRETKRLKYFATYVKKGKTPKDRKNRSDNPFPQLFLSDFTGEPVSSQTFYDAWTEASRIPYKGWSPQSGRHYWACNELLMELEKTFSAVKNLDKSEIPLDWIRGNVQDSIYLRIRPQLGHVDSGTTERYITWVLQQYRGTEISDQYENALENNTIQK